MHNETLKNSVPYLHQMCGEALSLGLEAFIRIQDLKLSSKFCQSILFVLCCHILLVCEPADSDGL